MKIIYIANARIPTEKAHGVQIVRTCEALARDGADLELWLPDRKDTGLLEKTSLFDFYNCSRIFKVRNFFTLDFLSLTSRWGGAVDVAAYLLLELSFVLSVVFLGKVGKGVVYTRCLTAALALKVLLGKKVFFEVHSVPVNNFSLFIYRLILNRLDGVVAISEGLKEILKLKRPVEVVSNAVDLKAYQRLSKNQARKILKLNDDKKYVVYTGFVCKSRGIEIFLGAEKFLKNPDVNFLLVGRIDKNDEGKFRAWGNNQRISFAGYVSPGKVPLYQKAADVLVLPTGKDTLAWDKKHGT